MKWGRGQEEGRDKISCHGREQAGKPRQNGLITGSTNAQQSKRCLAELQDCIILFAFLSFSTFYPHKAFSFKGEMAPMPLPNDGRGEVSLLSIGVKIKLHRRRWLYWCADGKKAVDGNAVDNSVLPETAIPPESWQFSIKPQTGDTGTYGTSSIVLFDTVGCSSFNVRKRKHHGRNRKH